MKILNNVYIKNTSVLSLDTTNTIAPANAGEMAWNQADGTLDLRLYNGTTLQSGQEIHVYGKASGNINNGDVVQFAGAQGDHILVKKAVGSEIKLHPEYIVGIATSDILNGDFGYITHFGKVHELDTEDYVPGTVLYFDCATSALITTVPVAPNPTITMAAVLRQHQNEGSMLVRPRWSSSLSTLNDVDISDIQDGQVISWNAANSRWENGSVSVAAEDVSIIDSGDYFTSTEMEGALQEAGNLLDNALYGSDPVTGDPIPVDADTLQGHAANYFAVASHTHDDRYYTESEIDTMLSSLSSAAEDITIVDTGNYFTSTDVEGALQEVGLALSSVSAAAADITIADSGNLYSATNVEDALQEVAAPKGIQLFDQTIDTNFTIPSTKNALSVGPITIADGVTVTIEDGASWVVA